MNGWGIVALAAGGLFTTAVVYFAVVRVPRWRGMEVRSFLPDFERTIDVADKVQPTLLVVTIAASAMLVRSAEGTPEALAGAAIAGFATTLFASLAIMVPLQRRMIRLGADPAVPIRDMRSRWLKGHLGRAALTLVSFVLLAAAVVQAS